MTQEFVTLPREVVEQALEALINEGEFRKLLKPLIEKSIDSIRAALDQTQANQPAMTPIAQRKLEDLMASGYTISGYSIYHEQKHQHGFVTGAGLVGWWRPEGMEYPQPRCEQPLRYLDGGSRYKVTHLKTSGYCIIGLPEELLGRWVALVDATDNKHMDSHQQPPTTEQSSAVQQPQGEQGPVAWISPRALEWETRQSEKVVKLTCKAQPEYGFTEPLYTHSQPKREPLTDNQIDKIAESMPGGLEGFLKGWGWRQFERAVLENDHNIK